MLETINGFDLLLVIVIVGLVFKVFNLNDECNSYVRQIIEVSQDNHFLKLDIQTLSAEIDSLNSAQPNLVSPDVASECMYCLGIEEMVTGNECYCEVF